MGYEAVIEKIGGGVLAEAARKLELPLTTVANWRTRGIPEWRKDHIRKTAQRLMVVVEE